MENLIENSYEPKKFCKYCGERVALDAVICVKCGRQIEELNTKEPNVVINNNVSSISNATSNPNFGGMNGRTKSKGLSIILCLLGFMGLAGMHKFYEGKIVMGIIYFITGGIMGIGTIIDVLRLLGKPREYYV